MKILKCFIPNIDLSFNISFGRKLIVRGVRERKKENLQKMQFQKKKFSETRSEFWRLPNANTRAEEREKSGGLYVDKYRFPSLFQGLRNPTFFALTGFPSFFAVFPYFLVHKFQNLGYQELSVCIYLFPTGQGDATYTL